MPLPLLLPHMSTKDYKSVLVANINDHTVYQTLLLAQGDDVVGAVAQHHLRTGDAGLALFVLVHQVVWELVYLLARPRQQFLFFFALTQTVPFRRAGRSR